MYMRILPNIEITKEQLNYIKSKDIFNYGSESYLYIVPSIFGFGTVAKIWLKQEEQVIYNKFEKIKRLYQIEILKEINAIQILKSISCEGRIVGYTMNKSSYQEINQVPMTGIEVLQKLLLTRQKLQQFLNLEILYGDISSSNILVSENDICFCDLDNVSYQELKMDTNSKFLNDFITKYGIFDEKAISYMHNLLTIKELCLFSDEYQVQRYLRGGEVPTGLSLTDYRYICAQMLEVTPSYEGYYLIDFIEPKYKQKIMIF